MNKLDKLEFLKNPPATAYRFEDLKITYNQNLVSLMSCVLHAFLTAISNQYNIYFDLDTRKRYWNLAKAEYGASDTRGAWVAKIGEMMKRVMFEDYGIRIEIISSILGSSAHYRMLKNGYMSLISGRINRAYWEDVFSDGDIDESQWAGTDFSHIWTIAEVENKIKFVENYKGKTFNVYDVTKEQIDILKMKVAETRDNYFNNSVYFVVNPDAVKVENWAVEDWNKWAKILFDNPNPSLGVQAHQYPFIFKKFGDFIKKEIVKNHNRPIDQQAICVIIDRLNNLNK